MKTALGGMKMDWERGFKHVDMLKTTAGLRHTGPRKGGRWRFA